jgi:hypothetical protein
MFGTYFKASLKVLPWIVLLPLAAFVLHFPLLGQTFGTLDFLGKVWEETLRICMLWSCIAAVLAHLLFLLIIPCGIGGGNSGAKRAQFYVGFFITVAAAAAIPIFFTVAFGLSGGTLAKLILLHLIAYPIPFVCGALFVAPAYARAFWFTYRK